MQFTTNKENYTKFRKGSAKLYQIICCKCNSEICLYKKEGAGNLLRMFLDKFVSPNSLIEISKVVKTKKDLQGLKCPSCNELVGVPMVYEKDGRLAFRLIPNKIIKKEINK